MNYYIFILILFIVTTSCKKDDDQSTNTAKDKSITSTTTLQKQAKYWGCWHEINKTPGVYDIILTEGNINKHGFEFGNNCIAEQKITKQNIGVFRNDTLILDNGVYEYWCFISGDTLLYSVYLNDSKVEKFLK